MSRKTLMARPTPKRLDENGFASIVIALILIIVLALFTVGFAQLARREQKSALDKQLATQAYYAAESGVNDTMHNLATLQAQAAAGNPPNPDTCLNNPVTIGPSQNGAQYTCVLVNLKPPSLVYNNVQPEAQRYVTSSSTSSTGAAAASITVHWGSTDGNSNYPSDTSGGFLPAATWNQTRKYPAVLQFSLTPLSDLSRSGLENNTFNAYLYPTSTGSGQVSYATGGNGVIVAASCNASNGAQYPCKATINNLNGGTGKYLFRIIAHYDPSDVTITGTTGNNGSGNPTG